MKSGIIEELEKVEDLMWINANATRREVSRFRAFITSVRNMEKITKAVETNKEKEVENELK